MFFNTSIPYLFPMKKISCSALFVLFFVQIVQAQDCGKVVITNANNGYPQFIVALNGVRLTNNYGHSTTFDCVDEINYKVRILQSGTINVLKFAITNEGKYESKYLIVQDNAGQYSLVLQSKNLILGNQAEQETDDEYRPVKNGMSYGTKVPGNVEGGTKVPTNTVTVVTVVSAPTPPPAPVAMTTEVFMRKFNDVKSKTFDREKMDRAKAAFASEKMTVNQVISVMKLFSFDDDKVDWAKYAYSKTLDKSEYYRTSDEITSYFTKEDFNKWINGQAK